MRDLIGRTLGHYRIVEKIGEGGMGVVYRALDERLDRGVAIKAMPADVAADPDRLRRFEREAKLLASLSHQNIATLYGLEEHEGQRLLVMELVEGETLTDRLEAGPIPIDDALEIALQVADGLEAAHEIGVIHRDLKPANVMVSADGKVKILDFGLAKVSQPDEGDVDLTSSPTATDQMTAAGVLLGTAAYMSPEQARGKPVGRQTDIWAFGVLFWEILTGKRLFAGETASDVLASVLKDVPDLEALPAATPAPVRRLLSRCLAKDPRNRLQSAADARLDIRDALSGAEPSQTLAASAAGARSKMSFLVFPIAVIVAAAAGGFLVWSLMRPAPEPVSRFVLQLPEPESLVGPGTALAISPDGEDLVYAAEREGTVSLYLRPIDSLEARPLPGTEGARGPFFSPGGEWVGFWTGGELKKIPLAGGLPTRVCESARYYGATWTPDDTIYFAPGNSGIYRVPASGGDPESVTVIDRGEGEVQHSAPEVTPRGDALLFHIWYGDTFDIAVRSLETGEQRVFVDGATFPRLLPTGHLLYWKGQSRSLEAVRFDLDRLETVGSAAPVLDNLWYWIGAQYSVSRDGLLMYVTGGFSNVVSSKLVWLDRDGTATPLGDDSRHFSGPKISPNGKRVAVSVWSDEVGVSSDIWVLDVDRGIWNRLTFEGTNLNPVWAPDGRRLYFSSSSPIWQVFWVPADGSDQARLLTTGVYGFPSSVTPDGESLLMSYFTKDEGSNIGLLQSGGGGDLETLVATPFNEHSGVLSPDGRWLAYVSNESGRNEVYVRPFPALDTEWVVSAEGGTSPRWSSETSELFYRQGDRMMTVPIEPGPSPMFGRPNVMFEGEFAKHRLSTSDYDVSADGQSFMMLEVQGDAPRRQINVVLNWFDELNRLVPAE